VYFFLSGLAFPVDGPAGELLPLHPPQKRLPLSTQGGPAALYTGLGTLPLLIMFNSPVHLCMCVCVIIPCLIGVPVINVFYSIIFIVQVLELLYCKISAFDQILY
jgi:hypothetical protein